MLSCVQLFVTLRIVANLPCSSVNGIFPARVLEWAVISSSKGSFQLRDQTHISCVSCITGIFFTAEPLGKPWHIVQFSSVAQSCLTLCNPMNCRTPGLPLHHQLLELAQTHVQLSRWYHPTISSSIIPFSSYLQFFPASGSFPMSQLFAWGGQSTGVSALPSVLPMNTQDWSPLGWTGWISLQSKGLSRVFSNTTVQKHQLFGTQFSS